MFPGSLQVQDILQNTWMIDEQLILDDYKYVFKGLACL